ncbi:MAG: hypothetical protein ACI4WS_05990, partial [Oscillospiraceae bacterium]
MKRKRVLAALLAGSVFASSLCGTGITGSIAFAESPDEAYFSVSYDGSPLKLEVYDEDGTTCAGALYSSGSFGGGSQLFEDFEQNYSAISVGSFYVQDCTISGVTSDDVNTSIYVLYGENSDWYETDAQSITLEQLAGEIDIEGKYIHDIGIRAVVSDSALLDAAGVSTVVPEFMNLGSKQTFVDVMDDDDTIQATVTHSVDDGGNAVNTIEQYSKILTLPGIEYGVTTVGELKEKYAFICEQNTELASISPEGIPVSAVAPTTIVVASDENWGNYQWLDKWGSPSFDVSTIDDSYDDLLVREVVFKYMLNEDAVSFDDIDVITYTLDDSAPELYLQQMPTISSPVFGNFVVENGELSLGFYYEKYLLNTALQYKT